MIISLYHPTGEQIPPYSPSRLPTYGLVFLSTNLSYYSLIYSLYRSNAGRKTPSDKHLIGFCNMGSTHNPRAQRAGWGLQFGIKIVL